MNIFTQIKNSIYNKAYYKSLLHKRFGESVTYYFEFAAITSLVLTIILSIVLVPLALNLSSWTGQIASRFPADLSVTINNGVATSNVPEPYAMLWPAATSSNFTFATSSLRTLPTIIKPDPNSASTTYTYAIIVDTHESSKTITPDTFIKADTAVLLTSDSIYYYKDKGVAVASLAGGPNVTISRGTVTGFVAKVQPFVKYLLPFGVLSLFIIIMLGLLISVPIYMIFGALFVWFILWITGHEVKYGKAYQVGLHAITLPILLAWIPINFFSTLLMMLMVFLNFGKKHHDHTAHEHPVESGHGTHHDHSTHPHEHTHSEPSAE